MKEDINIRAYRPDDLAGIKQLTVEAFAGVTLEENVEAALGILHGRDWRWRKARHIDEDVAANPAGIFVAEAQGRIAGYISTRVDHESSKGRIPNLAVAAEFRGQGLGRRLIEAAVGYFRRAGLAYAMIETLPRHEAGHHLYPVCGFVEVARQIHFARRL